MSKKFDRLTRMKIRALKSGSISEHGITFERLENGDGRYSVNMMVDGQRIHRVIGHESDGTTRTQAEEFMAKARQDAKAGRLNLPKGRKITLGFREAGIGYLNKLAEAGGKDLKMKRTRLTHNLIPFFGDTPLSKISTFDVERYKKHRSQQRSLRGGDRVSTKSKEGNLRPLDSAKYSAPASINRELAVLSHLFNQALEWGWIDRRPAKINRLKEDNGRIVYLTVEQVGSVLEHAKVDDNPQIYPFIVIGVQTAMRLMEILSIRKEDVDLNRNMIFVPDAKTGKREQPIPRSLADFLAGYIESLPADTQWLFPSTSTKEKQEKQDIPDRKDKHTVDIRKPFIRVIKAAGLDPKEYVRHTLRHTAITHLVQEGVDLPTVKRISGHKTLAMVERYFHANGAHIQAAMEKLQSRLKIA